MADEDKDLKREDSDNRSFAFQAAIALVKAGEVQLERKDTVGVGEAVQDLTNYFLNILEGRNYDTE